MKTIFLIGFPVCGKSTVGVELARQLGREFVDLDALVERSCGQSVSALFATEGEQAFRERERACLIEVLHSGAVVATGGGAPCYADNMALMNAAGITVWLTAPEAVLTARLQRPEYKLPRPAVAALSDDEIARYVCSTLAERTPFYTQAHIHFDATHIETAEETIVTAAQLAQRLLST